MIDKNNLKDLITYILVIILFITAVYIIRPFLSSIIYGALLAYIFYPLYIFLKRYIKNSFVSALLVCSLVIFLIIVFIVIIFSVLFRQAIEFYLVLQKLDINSLLNKILPSFITSSQLSTTIISSLSTSISSIIANYLRNLTDALSNLPIIIIKLLVVVFTFFFALKDGEAFIEYVKSLSPLRKDVEEKFFKHLKDVTNSILIGQILVGIIQGIFAGIGYFILGVPNALLLTFLTIVFSIIPFLGAWVIWFPVDIYLYVIGETKAALILFIYGIFVVSFIDNIIRSLILSKKTKINTAIVMIGMLGGIFSFGILGLIIGPLILGYVILIFEIYKKGGNQTEDIVIKSD